MDDTDCRLGTCYCEWFNQLSKQCEREDYILDSLRDRSWADPLDHRALRISRLPSRKVNLPMPYLDCSTVDGINATSHLWR
jgi:hypothetical protein